MAAPTRSTTPRRIAVAQRRAQALELRRAGLTYQAIADRMGYRTRSLAYQDVHRALDQAVRVPAEQVLAEELSRLDGMLTGLWPAARRGDVQAVDRVLRIMERRARYLGLDNADALAARRVALAEEHGTILAAAMEAAIEAAVADGLPEEHRAALLVHAAVALEALDAEDTVDAELID